MGKLVKADLNEEQARRFEIVKEEMGLIFNADILRVLISQRYAEIKFRRNPK